MKIRSPRYHREIPQRYRLEAAKTQSGKVYFPPRVCYTVVHTPAAEYSDLAPFAIGIIDLDDGGRITAQIVDVDPSDVKTGMRVKIEFRKMRTEGDEGLLCYGYKVVPE